MKASSISPPPNIAFAKWSSIAFLIATFHMRWELIGQCKTEQKLRAHEKFVTLSPLAAVFQF